MTRMSTRSSTRRCEVHIDEVHKYRTRRNTSKIVVHPVSSDFDRDEESCVTIKQEVPITPRKEKFRTAELELMQDDPVTPPKQRKLTNVEFLGTPKQKKLENNENFMSPPRTPSTLLKKLVLSSPDTKTCLSEEKENRKNLFKENIYANARKALHSTFPTDMPGREKELEELRSFIKCHFEKKTSGSLYVSGPPGTGKTASLNVTLQEDNVASEFKQIYVNCTAIKSSTSIFSRLVKELGIKATGRTEKDYLYTIESYLKKNHKMILLVLDEIDQLESKNQSVLYTIFEWPSKPNSCLILIGIANALDLTDRILPRLQARCDLKPRLMHFAPYTKQQIVQIFTSRLKAAGVLNVFSPVALQMLAGKVAAVSGDVRRALDIGRRVVELVDQSKNSNVLKPIENLANELVDNEVNSTSIVDDIKPLDEDKPRVVDLKQVVNVLNNVYGTSQNLSEDADEAIPLQQKIIICSLLLMLKKAKNKDITIGKLHEVYRKVCRKRNILAVDQSEFVGLCSLIETRGIIRVIKKKEARLSKVNMEWDEEEVSSALKDKQLMSMILQDDSCLGKL